jgi:NAD(P) transhydrogenase subunit beta
LWPIGGADNAPVVISLLNSFTGVAAACGGFLYDNKVMLTAVFWLALREQLIEQF